MSFSAHFSTPFFPPAVPPLAASLGNSMEHQDGDMPSTASNKLRVCVPSTLVGGISSEACHTGMTRSSGTQRLGNAWGTRTPSVP